ncbi:MAG TPA: radical SAM protein [Phycisphaerae bacterium]|nr:radical SAM protein [Phycisphaerae bacterium]
MVPDQRAEADPIRDHRRQWRECLYVYPVVSRRSKGLSIGVNLNPDKRCTFSCVYCQIDRRRDRGLHEVDMDVLAGELKLVLQEAIGGRLWAEPRFASTPAAMRRINDIAFSGDGEPTCLATFDRAVEIAAAARRHFGLDDLKLVVISNASQFHRPQFQRALPTLDANNGEIWAKLDAGTEEMFHRINRPYPTMPLRRVLDNILSVARGRPVIIQSLFMRLDGTPPPPDQIDAYCRRLGQIIQAGGKIKLVQVYTIARSPASASVSVLTDAELDAVAARVRSAIAPVPVEAYYGLDAPPQ